MNWTKVKSKLPARGWWVIGCKADGRLPTHSRLVRVRLTRKWASMTTLQNYWVTYGGKELPLSAISHWALIELPEPTIEKLSLGDKVRRVKDGSEYIVAASSVDFVALINVKNGKRWRKPVFTRDKHNITGATLERLLGKAKFELVK